MYYITGNIYDKHNDFKITYNLDNVDKTRSPLTSPFPILCDCNTCSLMKAIKKVFKASENLNSATCTIETDCIGISCAVGSALGTGYFSTRIVKPTGDQPGGIYIPIW